jgi:serralysin
VLNLVSRRSQGYPNITVTTEGGGSPRTFTGGYFESRMRWTKGNGAWPAFWLLSYRHAVNPAWPSINPYCALNGLVPALCYAAELDVFEGQGSEPNVFYGTIHRNSSEDYGVRDSQNANNYHDVGIDLTAAFHAYGMLWTATEIRWYLDGRFIHSAPVYDSTNQPMFLLLDMYIGGWTSGTDATTPNELKAEVDWVQVWQK